MPNVLANLTLVLGSWPRPYGTGQLAYRPFLEPIHIGDQWFWMLVFLVGIIATVYKTIKLDDLSKLPKQAAVLSIQIVVFMILTAVVLWMLSEAM